MPFLYFFVRTKLSLFTHIIIIQLFMMLNEFLTFLTASMNNQNIVPLMAAIQIYSFICPGPYTIRRVQITTILYYLSFSHCIYNLCLFFSIFPYIICIWCSILYNDITDIRSILYPYISDLFLQLPWLPPLHSKLKKANNTNKVFFL